MWERSRATIFGGKFLTTALLALGVLAANRQQAEGKIIFSPRTFTFKIDPKTPLNELLPTPPRASPQAGPLLADDLTQVPQVHFQEPLKPPARPAGLDGLPAKEQLEILTKIAQQTDKLLEQTAHQIAKINFLNRQKTDHFMHLLLERRPDLGGLPFVVGDACRLSKQQSEHFTGAVRAFDTIAHNIVVAQRRAGEPDARNRDLISNEEAPLQEFWKRWSDQYPPKVSSLPHWKEQQHAVLAALVQMLPTGPAKKRLGLGPYLAAREDKEAKLALTRLALFDADDSVRKAALKALVTRKPGDVNDLPKQTPTDIGEVLLQGLNYPWPEIARNAADAIAYLKRTDLVPKLIGFLDQPDPRAPVLQEVKGKQVPVVREVVRINHHRNCLLCHAPGNTPDVTGNVLTAGMPTPGESLSPSGYRMQSPDVLVRADVTYLRQDFSRLQKVEGAAPWPEMQRFDFLVRTRVLSAAEAQAYRAEFARRAPTSPYRQAALAALRSLTGRDAEPTAAAWRKVLASREPAQP